MSKRQTRRSISVKGLTGQRLRKLAKKLDELGLIRVDTEPGFSPALEYLIAKECKLRGIPEETALEPRRTRNTGPNGTSRAGGIFTW